MAGRLDKGQGGSESGRDSKGNGRSRSYIKVKGSKVRSDTIYGSHERGSVLNRVSHPLIRAKKGQWERHDSRVFRLCGKDKTNVHTRVLDRTPDCVGNEFFYVVINFNW